MIDKLFNDNNTDYAMSQQTIIKLIQRSAIDAE